MSGIGAFKSTPCRAHRFAQILTASDFVVKCLSEGRSAGVPYLPQCAYKCSASGLEETVRPSRHIRVKGHGSARGAGVHEDQRALAAILVGRPAAHKSNVDFRTSQGNVEACDGVRVGDIV